MITAKDATEASIRNKPLQEDKLYNESIKEVMRLIKDATDKGWFSITTEIYYNKRVISELIKLEYYIYQSVIHGFLHTEIAWGERAEELKIITDNFKSSAWQKILNGEWLNFNK